MQNRAILIPGNHRLREIHAIAERGGPCEHLFDVERNLLIDVPVEYQYYIAVALDIGDLDQDLISWLASEDLLTTEGWSGEMVPAFGLEAAGRHSPERSGLYDLSFETSPWGGLGCVSFAGDRAHLRIGRLSALESSGTSLMRLLETVPAVTLHLDLAGPSFDIDGFRRLVAEAGRRSRYRDRLRYEVTTDCCGLTPEAVTLLSDHAYRVRVAFGPGSVSDDDTGQEQGLGLLLRSLRERLVVHSSLKAGERLKDLWAWGHDLGLERLHAVKVATQDAGRPMELQAFRRDLDEVREEMLTQLQAGLPSLLYEPMVNIVRRLVSSRDRQGNGREGGGWSGGYLGVLSAGRLLPVDRLTVGAPMWSNGDGACASAEACGDCWARELCSCSAYVKAAPVGIRLFEARGDRCDFWQAEVEAGILLHRQLMDLDPDYLLGIGGEEWEDLFDSVATGAHFADLKTC